MGLHQVITENGFRRAAKVVGVVLAVGVVFLFISTAVPAVVGADHSYVVLSDSMSPAIEAGSVVYVSDVPTSDVSTGDVITFRRASADTRVTHRVVDVVQRDGERRFRTKGDANEEPDPNLVSPDQVVGQVAFSVPLIGYVVSFAGTRLGLFVLVVAPAVALGASELWVLYTEGTAEADGTESGDDEP